MLKLYKEEYKKKPFEAQKLSAQKKRQHFIKIKMQ